MSAGFTVIKYGSVMLFNVVTDEVNQTPVFDESNTDLMYVKTIIRGTGVVTGHNLYDSAFRYNYDGTGTNYAGNATNAEISFRKQLPPRETFTMWLGCTGSPGTETTGGTQIFNVAAMPYSRVPPGPNGSSNISLVGYDLQNGPRCNDFKLDHLAGNETFRVAFEFELNHLECPGTTSSGATSYGVLSNRWSCNDAIDSNLQVVRTYTGTLVCASQNINAQSFRWLCIPQLQPLMRIDGMNFQVTPDGLKLNWTVVHKEIASAAPYPARTWSVAHRESVQNGLKGVTTIDVDLTGDSLVDKSKLISLAFWIIYAKAFGATPDAIKAKANNGADFLKQFLVQSIEFVDYIGDTNRISARASIQRLNNVDNDITVSFALLGKPLQSTDLPTSTPTYNQSLSWGAYAGQTPEWQGPAKLAGIFACYLQNPCTSSGGYPPAVAQSGQTKPANAPDQNATALLSNPEVDIPTVTIVDNITFQPPWASPYAAAAMYTFWQIDNLYKTTKMRAALPTGNATSGPNYNDSCVVIQVSNPQARRILRVSAERVGSEPELPDPDNLPLFPLPAGSGSGGGRQIVQTCLAAKIRPGTPQVSPLGQLIKRVDAEYLIALSRAPNAGEQLALGNDKWTSFGNQATDPSGALTNSNWS